MLSIGYLASDLKLSKQGTDQHDYLWGLLFIFPFIPQPSGFWQFPLLQES